jgi:hypothetical protein
MSKTTDAAIDAMNEWTPPLEWKVNGDRIWFEYRGQEIHFRFPFVLGRLPSRQILHLCEWLLLSPWVTGYPPI